MAYIALLALLVPSAPAADVAVRDDGKQLKGELRATKTGQLVFTPDKDEGGSRKIVEYRFATTPPPFRVAGGRLFTLAGGQQLSGTLLGMEKDRVALRTAWADRLLLPRDALVSLTHLPGQRTVFVDDLSSKLASSWKVQGEPRIDSALLLERVGQSASVDSFRPISEGRVSVNFRERDAPQGARWVVESVFRSKNATRTVRVLLTSDRESIGVDSGGLKGEAFDVARTKDVRRLSLDFRAGSLRISVDDSVAWYTLDAGPGGSLASVKLACIDLDKPGKPAGFVAFAEFAVDAFVPEHRHPVGDARQDELWLADGDQLFGIVTSVDAHSLVLKGRFGVKRYAWPALRGWYPRAGEKPAPAKGNRVRIGLHGGLRSANDVVEGTITSLDARRLELQHTVLGTVVIPRERVARLRPVE